MRKRLSNTFLLFSSALAITVGFPAYGQTTIEEDGEKSTPEYDADEIVVTATKSTQRIEDVPISISAYKQERMDQLGIRNIEDIVTLTPGLQIEAVRERASGSNIAIRGISSRVGASTTGVYIDDAPIQVRIIGYDATNVYPLVFDLERVEVLRGPQGTLYGAGSMGGNVRFITPKPNMTDWSVYGRAEIADTRGGDASYEGGVAVGGPIIADTIGFRASAWHRKDGGWVDRADLNTGVVTDANSNSQTTNVLRGAMEFRPSENITITPSVFYQETDVNDASAYWSTLSDKSRRIYKNGYPQYQVYDDYFVMPNLQLEADLGSVTLVSSTSYFKRRAYNEWDYSTVVPGILSRGAVISYPGYVATSYFIDRQENFSEELRLQSKDSEGPVSWIAGIYYAHRKQENFQSIDAVNYDVLSTQLGLPPRPAQPNALFPSAGQFGMSTLLITNQSIDESIAIFGEINIRPVEGLTVTGGIRVERARLDFVNSQSGIFNGPVSGGTANPKVTPITPKFSVSYDVDDDNMLYATVSKGYRIGGGNAALPATTCAAAMAAIGITAAPQSYEPDNLWSYEIGAKNSFFDDRLQISSSAFLIDWKNIQQQVFPACGFQYVDNIGGLRSKGFDVQLRAKVAEPLTLGVQAGYLHARYTDDAFPNDNTNLLPLVRKGNSPLGLRPWTVVLTADYDNEIGIDTSLYANATMSYLSEDKNKTAFLDNTAVRDLVRTNSAAQTLVNLRAGIKYKYLDISLFAKNLFDSQATTSRNHDHINSTLIKETSVRPRTIGLTATVRY